MAESVDPPKPKSWCYIRNTLGQNLDDQSMKAIPHAQAELYYHVTLKTMQAGTILGAIIGPVIRAVKGGRTAAALGNAAMNGAKVGLFVGAPLGPVMVYKRMEGLKKSDPGIDMDYAFFDRSYRLRYNRDQVRVDRSCYIGEIAGLAAAAATGSSLLGGIALGMAAGTIAGGIYNGVVAKKTK